MSSLLQFDGDVSSRGVHLQFIQTREGVEFFRRPHFTGTWGSNGPVYEGEDIHYHTEQTAPYVDLVLCHICGKDHPRIHIAIRKPCGMFGCWVVFRYNGVENVPDLSVPISVFKLPRGARALSGHDSSMVWHKGDKK